MWFTSEDMDNIEFELIYKFFKKTLPSLGFSIREPQIEYVEEILNMVKNRKKSLIVEAGVGTGKSFGYLVPLLHMQNADRYGFSIIVSTGTISLQEQLIKDIKSINKIMSLSNNIVLAKGKTHFLCNDRVVEYYSKAKENPEWISSWKNYSYFGDRAELSELIPNIDDIWEKVNVQECKFRDCNHYNDCQYIELRNQMKKKKSSIVTNHDQLIANAKLLEEERRPLFSTDMDIVVIDEAHNLEEKARSSLTENWTIGKIINLFNNTDRFLKKHENYKELRDIKNKITNDFQKIFEYMYKFCLQELDSILNHGNETQRFKLPPLNEPEIKQLIKNIQSYNISAQLVETDSYNFEDTIWKIEELVTFLKNMVEAENKVFWLEMKEKTKSKLSINAIPKDMGQIIYNYFFSGDKTPVILTSATISQPGEDNYERYDYLISALGIDNLTTNQLSLANPKQSPFDYKNNALLYIPSSLPHPKYLKSFRDAALSEIIKLLKLTDGRSMILFTSKEDMKFIHNELLKIRLPWEILIQQEGSSQNLIKEQFIKNEKSILLSTGIFWEGIDIPGPSLSNLIIFKLPFPVPDPILEYKTTLFSDGFSQVYLPEMLIKLRQGLGRLIRKETDKGIATILDSRLSQNGKKEYRQTVIDAIPFETITEDIEEVEYFIANTLKFV